MSAIDTRSLKRDSLFLSADITLPDGGDPVRVKVRNLSDGGMMAEARLPVERGTRLIIELRNIGSLRGSVAWMQDDRFGIVFDQEIDAKKVRAAPTQGDNTPRYARPSTVAPASATQFRPGSIRKI